MGKDFSFDDVPLGVCILSHDRKSHDILYANAILAHKIGVLDPADMIGQNFANVWPHKDGKLFLNKLKSTNPPKTYTLPIQSPKKEDITWVRVSISENEWQGQEVFMLWLTDISANKHEEERLQAEVKRADAMAEMKSNFLATMSHEIRTPMQTIYGLLELINEEKPEKGIQTMITTAQNAASGLLEILDDILDLAKMDANKMELDVFEVPVRTLVRGILEALSVKVQGIRVALIDDIAEGVPFVIIGDPKRLRQIIMNLTGNALKFTKEGSVTVRVTDSVQHIKVPKNKIGLRFEIVDTGIGMSQEVCDKLFGSFTQADSSTSRQYGGTGLGLSISKKLVELMGGKIGVTSEEGTGSVFWFEIPTEEVGTDTNTVELPELDGISVLSVEDHPQGAREIVNSLRSMGAVIESCPTYKEGLELIERRPFDVAVIDQGLPDGLGLDLIREAMQIRPNMGMIMYTVRDDVGMQHTLQALGVTYLTKPASRAGLGEAVKAAASSAAQFGLEGPAKLLIAEDTESVQDVLRRQLHKVGVEADMVNNGQEALEALRSGAYGILITDLHMPELDGYGLVEAIREGEKDSGKHFPVIVLTADVQMAQRDTYLRYGFDECLLKPVSLGQFRRLLIRWGLLNEEAPNAALEEPDIERSDNAAGNENSAVDVRALAEQMGAFDNDAIEMLHTFVEMSEPLIDRIVQAQNAGDHHDLAEAAHSLKGSARFACANVLGDIASDLQDTAEEQGDSQALVDNIVREFDRVKSEIKTLKAA